ncbi:MAG TPA: hypothetical protein VM115_13170 [Vicinamibacterales bacterium]|nr:hypothetical protein [Vicinamibacterales bacterium]
MAERHERSAVAGFQSFEQPLARGLQMTEPQPLQAGTHVERQHHVQRNLFEAREIDVLTNTVIQDVEIIRCQPLQRAATLGHEHVDAHRINAAAERLPCYSRGRQRREAERDQRTS